MRRAVVKIQRPLFERQMDCRSCGSTDTAATRLDLTENTMECPSYRCGLQLYTVYAYIAHTVVNAVNRYFPQILDAL